MNCIISSAFIPVKAHSRKRSEWDTHVRRMRLPERSTDLTAGSQDIFRPGSNLLPTSHMPKTISLSSDTNSEEQELG
jgi:hypothetical protein